MEKERKTMKTTKQFYKIQIIILIILLFGWFQASKHIAARIQSQTTDAHAGTSPNYEAGNSKSLNKNNSLYYRYMQILNSRAKKHKV